MLSCLVENPPVAVVANDWHNASNKFMPPSINNIVSSKVSPI